MKSIARTTFLAGLLTFIATSPVLAGPTTVGDTLQLEVVTRIGSIDGPDALTAPSVAQVTETGSLVVLFAIRETAIKEFSPSGELLREFGRPGQGPGELSQPKSMQLVGDRLWVVDGNRVTWYSLVQDHSETEVPLRQTTASSEVYRLVARLTDGSISYQPLISSDYGLDSPFLYPLRAFDPARDALGDTTVVLTRYRGSVQFSNPTGGFGSLISPHPYPLSDVWAPLLGIGGVVVVGQRPGRESGEADVSIWLATGQKFASTTIRLADDLSVSKDERRAVEQFYAERLMRSRGARPRSLEHGRDMTREKFRAVEFRQPAEGVRVASDGSIWVMASKPYGYVGPSHWLVLDNLLRVQKWVEIPEGVWFLDARGESIWGWTTGDLDVPYLVRLSNASSNP